MVADRAMTPLAESFFQAHENELTALLSLALAAGLILIFDRTIKRRGKKMRSVLAPDGLDPVLDTRLRFVRRAVEATIAIIGIAVAISQFAALDRLATSILASGALAAAVIGFAARQTLANAVAGVLLFITQPVRIGDLVTVEGVTGTVEDVRLTYTWLRSADDTRLIVPNERLAANIIRNDSIVTPRVIAEVAIWLPAHTDAERACTLLDERIGEAGTVRPAEMDPEGRVRLAVTGTAGAAHDRAKREAELRGECLRILRGAGLLAAAPAA
jgi:small conductance mechanosensitive channel